jgi:hypothetical protein
MNICALCILDESSKTCLRSCFCVCECGCVCSGTDGSKATIQPDSPDLDSYGKPLPSPPSGFHWERLPDGSWDLIKTYNIGPAGDSSILDARVFDAPVVIEHVVLPGDTLPGICLRYHVSAVEVRRHNLFSGNNIQFKKTLRIPLEPGIPVTLQGFDRKEMKLQLFKNETGEETTEATLYLETHNWDVVKAIAEWRQDDLWAKQQQQIEQHRQEMQQQDIQQQAPTWCQNGNVVAPVAVVSAAEMEMIQYSTANGFEIVDDTRLPLLA